MPYSKSSHIHLFMLITSHFLITFMQVKIQIYQVVHINYVTTVYVKGRREEGSRKEGAERKRQEERDRNKAEKKDGRKEGTGRKGGAGRKGGGKEGGSK